jgi:hypothetical protein
MFWAGETLTCHNVIACGLHFPEVSMAVCKHESVDTGQYRNMNPVPPINQTTYGTAYQEVASPSVSFSYHSCIPY